MTRRFKKFALAAAVVAAAGGPGQPALAQGMPGKTGAEATAGPGYEVTAELRRYREMAGLMRDMSRQMDKLHEAMEKGEMAPEKRARMRKDLADMSDLMRRMSGLVDRPSMNDAATRQEMKEMRTQMDHMMRNLQ